MEQLFRQAEWQLLPESIAASEALEIDPERAREQLETLLQAHPGHAGAQRYVSLQQALADSSYRPSYRDAFGIVGVQRFETRAGTRIYLLKVETFPGHINNVYVIRKGSSSVLFDLGSGSASSRQDMRIGFAILREVYGEPVWYEEVDVAVISHAHIDHFGGATELRERSSAQLCVHELDARVITDFEERVVVVTKDVEVYLRRAGVDDHVLGEFLSLYAASKQFFRSQKVDRTLRDGEMIGDGYRVIHVPGHCPGLICLQVDDTLLTSDHVLSRTTPHQFPQALSPFGGLWHYFDSLEKVRRLTGVRLGLGGHEDPIADVPRRTLDIESFHRERLAKIRRFCEQPRTIWEVTAHLFPHTEDYGRLLAVEEAGAHVEYLHMHGDVRIANLAEVEASRDPVLRYQQS